MIFGPDRDIFQVARNFAHFFAHESCGFCTPCRVGTDVQRDVMDKIAEGRGSRYEVNDLMRLVEFMSAPAIAASARRRATRCATPGTSSARPSSGGSCRAISRPRSISTRRSSPRANHRSRRRRRAHLELRHDAIDARFTIDESRFPSSPARRSSRRRRRRASTFRISAIIPTSQPHGGCKLCTVVVNGRTAAACTMKAAAGQEIDVDTPELDAMRRSLVQMLFVEGNHFCPGCEKSGNCQLQALGYEYEMLTPHFVEFYPHREVDASHPDVLIDFNRCILCELCVRASRDVDDKNVFALAGRGRPRRSSSIRRPASSATAPSPSLTRRRRSVRSAQF